MKKGILIMVGSVVVTLIVALALSGSHGAAPGAGKATSVATKPQPTSTMPSYTLPPAPLSHGKPAAIKLPYLPGDGNGEDSTHGADHSPDVAPPTLAQAHYEAVSPVKVGPFMAQVPYQDGQLSITVGPDGYTGDQVELVVQYNGSEQRAQAHVAELMRESGDDPTNYTIIYLSVK